MKWLLVEPPALSAVRNAIGAVGIPSSAYLAPIVREEGEEVQIEDAPTMDHSLDDVKKKIRSLDPDYVGITAMTSTVPSAYNVAKATKEFDSDTKVIMGGIHPTFMPKRTLKECSAVDVVVRGEGEETIRELARGQDWANVKGITYREGDEIVENEERGLIEDLDDLPFPAYDLVPMNRYKVGGVKYSTIMSSRGCPFNCIFCSSSRIFGREWRGKSPERVLEQLKLLAHDFDVHEVEFLDDTFTLNRVRAERICDLITGEGLNISWSCSSRVDTIDKSLAEKLKEAGCHTVYLGIESGVQKVLDTLKKGITIEQVENAVKAVRDAGMNTVGSFILGIPSETRKQMEKTVDFAKELDLTLAQFTIFTPYPGTEAWGMAEEKNLLLTRDWSKYSTLDPVIKHPEMKSEELKNFLRKAYISFYLRPSFIWKAIKSGSLWSLLKRGVRSLF